MATVGLGKVKVMAAVVWVISKVVATSTVLAAVPIVLLLTWLAIAAELNIELLALVNGVPDTTVRPPLKVPSPVTPSVPPKLVAPVPTVKVLVPLIEVAPFRVTAPVPVEKVPLPVWAMLPPAKVLVPVPTLKVLVPVILRLPPKLLAPAVTVKPPAVIVSPPLVTVKPVPIVALFVTVRPVPAPPKVLSPAKD